MPTPTTRALLGWDINGSLALRMIVDQDMCGVWEGGREVRTDVVGTKQGLECVRLSSNRVKREYNK
jgi:hypothetical protein